MTCNLGLLRIFPHVLLFKGMNSDMVIYNCVYVRCLTEAVWKNIIRKIVCMLCICLCMTCNFGLLGIFPHVLLFKGMNSDMVIYTCVYVRCLTGGSLEKQNECFCMLCICLCMTCNFGLLGIFPHVLLFKGMNSDMVIYNCVYVRCLTGGSLEKQNECFCMLCICLCMTCNFGLHGIFPHVLLFKGMNSDVVIYNCVYGRCLTGGSLEKQNECFCMLCICLCMTCNFGLLGIFLHVLLLRG